LQAGGRRFESDRLHRNGLTTGLVPQEKTGPAVWVGPMRVSSPPCPLCGRAAALSSLVPLGDGVFFVSVNQVLVRLWARHGRMSDRWMPIWGTVWVIARDRGGCVQGRFGFREEPVCAERVAACQASIVRVRSSARSDAGRRDGWFLCVVAGLRCEALVLRPLFCDGVRCSRA
jgi:hypothetical protein